jgi:hypothetical protein
LAVASALARAANAQFIQVTGEGQGWEQLTPARRAQATRSQVPWAQVAVDTLDGMRLVRVISHQSLLLLDEQVEQLDGQWREQRPSKLVLIDQAVDVAREVGAGLAWSPSVVPPGGPVPHLVRAAALLLAAADALLAEEDLDGAS